MSIQNSLFLLHEQFLQIRSDLDIIFEDDAVELKRVEETAEKLSKDAQQGQLSTLIFGYYNAGKSTFINALLGCEVAAMGDVPLTGCINSYDWNGYVLFDSPGIDAPIEHEVLTDDFIRRECNAVIFVISTGGAIEEASTWERLCKFVSEKKAVLIVINDKAGWDLNGKEFVRIRNSVYQNMQIAAKKFGVEDPLEHIQILHVKAKTALKARLEHKPNLLKMTGIPEAEAVLLRFLSASTEKIVASDSERARLLANDAIARLMMQSGSEGGIKLAVCRSKVEQERTRLESALVESTRSHVVQEVSTLYSVVASMEPARGADVDTILRSALEKSQSRLLVGVEKDLNNELDRTDVVVREAAQLLSQQVNKGEADVADVQLSAAEFSSGAASQDYGDSSASSVFEKMKSMPIDKMTESGVNEMLKLGKKWFPDLFKGIGKKTMDKWAGAAGKVAGPLVIIGQSGYDLYQVRKQETEAREQHRQFVLSVMGIVHQAFDDALGQYELMFKNIAKASLDPVLKALDDRALVFQIQSVQCQARQERLTTWTRNLGF